MCSRDGTIISTLNWTSGPSDDDVLQATMDQGHTVNPKKTFQVYVHMQGNERVKDLDISVW